MCLLNNSAIYVGQGFIGLEQFNLTKYRECNLDALAGVECCTEERSAEKKHAQGSNDSAGLETSQISVARNAFLPKRKRRFMKQRRCCCVWMFCASSAMRTHWVDTPTQASGAKPSLNVLGEPYSCRFAKR